MRRAFAVIAGFIPWSALALQFWLTLTVSGPERGMTVTGSIVWFLSFMTVLTNIWVGLTCALPLIAPTSAAARWLTKAQTRGALLAYILAVGIAYHVLLANTWDPQGLAKLADTLLHTIVPLIYLIHWYLFATKGMLRLRMIPTWLYYPLGYAMLAMAYGGITGRYPYPFLDLSKGDLTPVLTTGSLVLVGYVVLFLLVVFVDRALGLRSAVDR